MTVYLTVPVILGCLDICDSGSLTCLNAYGEILYYSLKLFSTCISLLKFVTIKFVALKLQQCYVFSSFP